MLDNLVMAESASSKLKRDDDFWDIKPKDCLTSNNNFEGVSVWCDERTILSLTSKLLVGDRLELVCNNLPGQLWGIYVNELNFLKCIVVFFISGNEAERTNSFKRTIWGDSFQANNDVLVVCAVNRVCSVPGCTVRINNSRDVDWPPVCKISICKEIKFQLKEPHSRSVLQHVNVFVCRNQFKDSEDFVNHCRYVIDHQHYMRNLNAEKVSEWFTKSNIQAFIREVRQGDRLELDCGRRSNSWGIYIDQWGDDHEQVVLFTLVDKKDATNLALTSSDTVYQKPEPELCVKSIGMFLGEYKVRINNVKDQTWSPLEWKDILCEINRQLEDKTHMCACRVSFKDSEEFVNYCRYDNLRINFGELSNYCDDIEQLPRMRVGDRLEFQRTARVYTHWAIYVGQRGMANEQVVHFTPSSGKGKFFSTKVSSISGPLAKSPEAFFENHISHVLGNDKVRINNQKDSTWPPLLSKDILAAVDRLLESQLAGNTLEYHIFSSNCEHFVNYCRYGRNQSDQVSRFQKISDHRNKAAAKEVLEPRRRRHSVPSMLGLKAQYNLFDGKNHGHINA